MADRSLSYYLGPDLSQGLLNIYNAGRGLLEFVSPGADVRDAVQSSQSAMQNLGQGNVGAGLLDLVYTPAALAGMFIPGSIGGTRRVGEAAVDEILGLVDDVDPSMPRRLVNRDDLPMDEASRMARAREMGFDTDVYHGSGADIQEFVPSESGLLGPGVYVADSPRGATKWAPDNVEHSPGGVTYPLKVRGQFASMEQLNAARDAARAQGAKGKDSTLKAIDALKAEGFIGISDNSGDVMTVFDPKNIRSRFAKFDPSKKDSANILAGVGGGLLATGVAGLLGAGAYGQQEQ